jgi:hypothetical protein
VQKPVAKDLMELLVAPDSYQVSAEPLRLVADLCGALAVCVHDEARGLGGLLHLRFTGPESRPSEVTDNTLSSMLLVLDRFKKAVLGSTVRHDEVHARVLAHALPPRGDAEPAASIVDLIQADFAEDKIHCGAQTVRRTPVLRVYFEPFAGRMWVSGPQDKPRANLTRTG